MNLKHTLIVCIILSVYVMIIHYIVYHKPNPKLDVYTDDIYIHTNKMENVKIDTIRIDTMDYTGDNYWYRTISYRLNIKKLN